MQAAVIILILAECVRSSSMLPTLSPVPMDERRPSDIWRRKAIAKLWDERKKMEHTPLLTLTIPGFPNVDFLFKDESASRTASLKHRYSWALVMWALIDGKINENTTVFEWSCGNTAASEAYMLNLIGVKFVALVPEAVEEEKVKRIRSYGGDAMKVPIGEGFVRAQMEGRKAGGFFINQRGNSDKAEEYHESGYFPLESVNVMHEIFSQLRADPKQAIKAPHYFVQSAGTGGTITSVGRYVKKYGLPTKIVMADTEFSISYDYVMNGMFKNESGQKLWVKPGMSGIGAGYDGPLIHGVVTSLLPAVIDRAVKVPDLASTAAMAVLKRLGISGGTSTGVNFVAALHLAATAKTNPASRGQRVSIATILGDPGYHYSSSYFNRTWIEEEFKIHGGLPVYDCWIKEIEKAVRYGTDPLTSGHRRCAPTALHPTEFRLRRGLFQRGSTEVNSS